MALAIISFPPSFAYVASYIDMLKKTTNRQRWTWCLIIIVHYSWTLSAMFLKCGSENGTYGRKFVMRFDNCMFLAT